MNQVTNYDEAVQWLNQRTRKGFGDLSRIQWVMARFDNSHLANPVIHVAGTNGKGSTTAFTRSILMAEGLKVGTFTSPHIETYNERIQINGVPIDDTNFCKYLNELIRIMPCLVEAGLHDLTQFEALMTVMFLYFRDHPVNALIVETGIGGLMDSTNIVAPLVTAITTIGFDHMDMLGTTLSAIAMQKAGIIKPGVPVVVGRVEDDLQVLFKKQAAEKQSDIYLLGDQFKSDRIKMLPFQNYFTYSCESLLPMPLEIETQLAGPHQIDNASVAITISLLFAKLTGVELSTRAIISGVQNTQWPGRLELIQTRPPIIIDGAHNLEAIQELVKYCRNTLQGQKIHFLFAALKTKPVDEMLQELHQVGNSDLFVTSFDFPNAMALEDYEQLDDQQVTLADDWQDFITNYMESEPSDVLIVLGSLYFISAVRTFLI